LNREGGHIWLAAVIERLRINQRAHPLSERDQLIVAELLKTLTKRGEVDRNVEFLATLCRELR